MCPQPVKATHAPVYAYQCLIADVADQNVIILHYRMSARFMREDGNEIDREIVKEAIHIHNRVSDEVFTLTSS